jgi:hypothetical protein
MLAALGGRARLTKRLMNKKERAACQPPLCCWNGWKTRRYVHRTSVGIYQYILIRVFFSILSLICQGAGCYSSGDWGQWHKLFPWAMLFINVSQIVALYCIVSFYLETHDWCAKFKPLHKFMVIKGVVFVSWWQGLGIAGATKMGLVPDTLTYSKEELAAGIQNFAICVEMLFAAIAFSFFVRPLCVLSRKTPLQL